MSKESSKGVLVVATGNPQYGRMAYNLAVTIKSVDKEANITVVYSGSSMNHLSHTQTAIFDLIIDLPDHVPQGCGAKLWANELSPYTHTLVLDADMLWLPKKKPAELFDSLAEVDFTAITEGYYNYEAAAHDINSKYFFWADPEEIKTVYKTKANKIYQWRSEVMYFRKSAAATKVFKTAQKVFLKPGLASLKMYATGVADELGINVSAAVNDVHPHAYKWMPSYWHLMGGGIIPDFAKLYAEYYLMSFGGNTASGNSQKMYNRLVKAACYKLGCQHVFTLASKRDYLIERKKM